MAGATKRWSDLGTRVLSGVLIAVLGFLGVIAGGSAFAVLVAAATGAMIWELVRLADPQAEARALILGILGGGLQAGITALEPGYGLVLLIAVPLLAAALASRLRVPLAVYGAAMMLAAWSLVLFRAGGVLGVLWIILVVMASDIAGYFAGRMLGGPKFWPRVSPKKTWSGTVAGWLGAAFVGGIFVAYAGARPMLIPLSALTAFAGQMGDIAESALKRAAGVKDSSALIPGHGGVLDRLDALLGAALFVFVVRLASVGLGIAP